MPEMVRPLSVDGDVRSLTFTGLDRRQSMAFRAALLGRMFTPMIPLAEGESAKVLSVHDNGSSLVPAVHIPGVPPTSVTSTQAKTTATIDDIELLAADIPDVDVNLSQFNEIARQTDRLAYGQAAKFEARLFRCWLNAARTAAVSGIHSGGNRVEIVSQASVNARYPLSTTGAANIELDLATLAQYMDDDNIPREGRVAFLEVQPYNAAGFSTRLAHGDYVDKPNAPQTRNVSKQIQGFTCYMTNNLPRTNYTSDLTKYNSNADIAAATGYGRPVVLAGYVGGPTPDGTPAFGPVTMLEKIAPEFKMFPDWDGRGITRFVHRWRYSLTPVDVWCAGSIELRSGS